MTKQLLSEVLSLPVEDRVELADIILQSLNSAINPEIEKAWIKEAEERFEAYKKGEIKTIDGNDFICAFMHLHKKPDYWKDRL
jgi:putative addiction module component (TIGR02574 family)